ncbi:unnamed protein product [Rotaria sp. Silwood1]|nr:unnamed protein product [Rotaria sp. Silwood1]CAF3452042.1 unnamed protein product [Rotaria sp. Silwood1]CAF3511148.1 unnamed protein product [Rotaria sp. Silwood1]CAF3541271.1 unnamed protein product [Rotaria sp. Silwood1]CAF3571631.1 unnamed protein product [Rotaria sp. Silwood1]
MGFTERFPRWITGVIGIVQLVLTAGILGLEIVSNYIDLGHGTIWVGIWASIIFIITFLQMFFITCCCRGRCNSFYVFIMTIVSGLLAIVVIYFDQLFMNEPCKCYLGDTLCCIMRGVPTFSSNFTGVLQDCTNALTLGTISSKTCPSIPYDKVSYIKAQLACAVAMVVTCAVYIVVFLFACFGVCFGH